jgi:hypothetical protein
LCFSCPQSFRTTAMFRDGAPLHSTCSLPLRTSPSALSRLRAVRPSPATRVCGGALLCSPARKHAGHGCSEARLSPRLSCRRHGSARGVRGMGGSVVVVGLPTMCGSRADKDRFGRLAKKGYILGLFRRAGMPAGHLCVCVNQCYWAYILQLAFFLV